MTDDERQELIEQLLVNPASVTSDGQTVRARSAKEIIDLMDYADKKTSSAKKFPFRIMKIRKTRD